MFLKQSASSGADFNGAALPSTTTSYQYDAFSNATQIEVTTSDGFGKTTTNTYSNDTANWLLGRLLTADVTSQVPDVATQIPVEDTTPDPFDFTNVTDAVPGQLYEDSTLISGVNRVLTASVSGGDARIRKIGGDWVSSLQVNSGETLHIRMTAGSDYGSIETATVTVGGAGSGWTITAVCPVPYTPVNDFANVTGAFVGQLQSASVLLSDLPAAFTATVTGHDAQIHKNGAGVWGTSVLVNPGDTLNIQMSASGAVGHVRAAVVTLGRAALDWTVRTTNDIVVPLACQGNRQNRQCNVSFNPFNYISKALNPTFETSFTFGGSGKLGPQIQAGTLTEMAGAGCRNYTHSLYSIVDDQCKMRTSVTANANKDTGWFSTGGRKGWRAKAAFNAATETLTLSGLSHGWGSSGGNWNSGRVTSIRLYGVTDDSTPDAFTLSDVTGAALNTYYMRSVTVSGIDVATPATVVGGGAELRINGGGWITSGTVMNGDTVEVRMRTSLDQSPVVITNLAIGGTSASWKVTTGCGE